MLVSILKIFLDYSSSRSQILASIIDFFSEKSLKAKKYLELMMMSITFLDPELKTNENIVVSLKTMWWIINL